MDTTDATIKKRADELESIGFVMECTKKAVFYVKGDAKIVATLIMVASTKEWNDFIAKNK